MKFFTIEDNFIKIDLDPDMYSLESAYAVGYQMLENAYIYFKGNPKTNIEVYISHIDDSENSEENLSLLGKKFLNHLVNHINYTMNSKEKELVRALLLKKSFDNIDLLKYSSDKPEAALKTECPEQILTKDNDSKTNKIIFEDPDKDFCNNDDNKILDSCSNNETKSEESFTFDDPEGIAIPWEEKYEDKQ